MQLTQDLSVVRECLIHCRLTQMSGKSMSVTRLRSLLSIQPLLGVGHGVCEIFIQVIERFRDMCESKRILE